MQDTKGYNPYKTGVVGGSDSHNTGVPYRQSNFFGGHASLDGVLKERIAGRNFTGLDTRQENPAGLTGVWAEENTRESLFNAMQRRETFATSGPHTMRVQVREDGVAFDQIVLSRGRYASPSASCPPACAGAPGPLANDRTLVPKP